MPGFEPGSVGYKPTALAAELHGIEKARGRYENPGLENLLKQPTTFFGYPVPDCCVNSDDALRLL